MEALEINQEIEKPQCLVCGSSPIYFRWTDSHGIGVCTTCGLPHRVFHYEGEEGNLRRVDKPPKTTITPGWVEVAKKYWEETKRRVFPGDHDMGLTRNQTATYSGATKEQNKAFWEWVKSHEDIIPPEETT